MITLRTLVQPVRRQRLFTPELVTVATQGQMTNLTGVTCPCGAQVSRLELPAATQVRCKSQYLRVPYTIYHFVWESPYDSQYLGPACTLVNRSACWENFRSGASSRWVSRTRRPDCSGKASCRASRPTIAQLPRSSVPLQSVCAHQPRLIYS
jgi:hypothetical protein